MGSVFEENDEAKREEKKKDEPKQSAHQGHGRNRNLGKVLGQCRRAAVKVRIEPRNETAKLFAPCGFHFST